MSELIVIAFDDEATGFELRAELVKMQGDYLIEMEDAVVVTRPSEGDIKLHQAVNLTAAGALGGGFWGTFVGLIFLNPLIGAAVGAASGALAGQLSDVGINDDFMRDTARALPPGGSAVFVLLRKMTADKVLDRLQSFRHRGRVLQTSLSREDEDRLRDALSGGAAVPPVPPAAPATGA
ncbi:DUF1269 domain-containing protein [Paracoccus sp. YIM 132242]|uniref:DUF1269 domain-containing protein n=1 Tax=Paracoccus lichenicola TaxID=2665644 RepID=A0A6L6HR75_9RHOB|nr:DUF1269 domain-containing protein [Paracoccus lichenicola]MTE00555.1 DUF1269 domain-containing protein [Paracoccus lichenicola]